VAEASELKKNYHYSELKYKNPVQIVLKAKIVFETYVFLPRLA